MADGIAYTEDWSLTLNAIGLLVNKADLTNRDGEQYVRADNSSPVLLTIHADSRINGGMHVSGSLPPDAAVDALATIVARLSRWVSEHSEPAAS